MSLLYDMQGIKQLPFEKGLTSTIPGQRGQRRNEREFTGQFTEIGFDAPQGDNKARLYVIFCPYFCEQRQMLTI